ncbi:MAG TPA: HEAT repeat domain-containing protein [Gemmatimonadaceae bacterium]|nr:HEAT repeat domain-containing protein [Gemmatimonadaceae bacterium]
MKQWLIAAVVLAALVPSADAQRPNDPKPVPKAEPRIRIEGGTHIDVHELEMRARELAERVRSSIDVEDLQWRAQEMAERLQSHDFSELQWRANEMAQRAQESMRDFDFDHDFDFSFDHDFDFDFDFDFDHDFDFDFDHESMQFDAQLLQERVRSQMHDAQWRLQDAQRELQRDLRDRQLDQSSSQHIQSEMELAMHDAQDVARRGLHSLAWSGAGDLGNIVLGGVMERFETRAQGPRPAWAPSDPADSLYRLAREMLNRGNYRRAAELFRDISDRYATSQYAPDALYWEAFALYRIGTTAELERARGVLEQQRARYADAYARSDGASLAQRIAGALAQRGDRSAINAVTTAAGQKPTCDKEELAVRVEALNALSTLDFSSARPILERVLARHDECTVGLRKRAVFLIGKQADASAAQLLSNVVRTEPNADVRGDAILWLSRVPGEQTVNMLDELLRNSTDERVQRTALRALAAHESPRARQIVRSTIERQDASDRLREYALAAINSEKPNAEDAAYLRGIYSRLTSERLKKAVVRRIGAMGGAENNTWLMGIARNNAEPMDMRAEALGRIGRSSDIAIRDLTGLYDQMAARELREQLLSVYARRKEPEATDKLIEIAKTGTDPQLRRMAISALTRKNDPRTTQLLLEIIEP